MANAFLGSTTAMVLLTVLTAAMNNIVVSARLLFVHVHIIACNSFFQIYFLNVYVDELIDSK